MNLLASIFVVTNLGFTAAYDTGHLCPSWVAYDLEPSEVVLASRKAIPFRADPRIPNNDREAFYTALKDTRYDRGHIAPAADFNYDDAALRETYLYTNVAPMTPRLNRGEWCRAEKEVRTLAASGTVHVVTFPVFDTPDALVPSRFVKVAWGWFGVRFWNYENK